MEDCVDLEPIIKILSEKQKINKEINGETDWLIDWFIEQKKGNDVYIKSEW